jgi:hypothetical protein
MPNSLEAADLIALCGGAVALVLFVLFAFAHGKHLRTPRDFLFVKSLERNRLAANISATATSLAGLLLFFFLQTPTYGWVILLVPLLVLLGIQLFLKVVKNVEQSPEESGSIYRFLFARTQSRSLSLVANTIVVTNFAVVLLIELVIGAGIFAYFAPTFTNATLWGMLAVGLIAIAYITIGGFEMVTQSDRWQFALVRLGLLLSLGLALIGYFAAGQPLKEIIVTFNSPLSSSLIWGTFLINAILVNLTLPTCQISSWQRFASTADKQTFREGIRQATLRQLGWVCLGAILIAALQHAWHGPTQSIGGILDFIRSLGIVGDLIAFPLLFVGLIAALISTADSMLISLMLGVDDFRIGLLRSDEDEPRRTLASNDQASQFSLVQKWLKESVRLRFVIVGLLALAVAIGFFLILESVGGPLHLKIVQLMFAGYGQAILLFPILLYASRHPNQLSSFDSRKATGGLIGGFIVLWAFSLWGIISENLVPNHLSAVFGFAVAGFGVFLARGRRVRSEG